MTSSIRRAAAALCAASLAALSPAARADTAPVQPFATPQHDVDVTYAMLPGEAAQVATQRLRWSAGLQAQRIDVAGSPTYVVTDHRAHLTAAVRLDGHGFIKEAAPGAVPAPGVPASGGYAPLAGAPVRIAGLSCREWQVADAQGQASVVCLTEDGVLLRARVGTRVLLLAQSVRTGALDPALFAIPAGPGR